MDLLLTETEVRVLGCLIEKEFSTPEYYPLSLNALVNACNQKSNRDPVVSYGEDTVLQALTGLRNKQLVFQSAAARVPKYEETFLNAHNFIGSEASVLCELMLRGAQTPGELRSRTERLHAFTNTEELLEALDKLVSYGYAVRLERQPGRKESRFMHLFCGSEPAGDNDDAAAGHGPALPAAGKIAALEEKITGLQHELQELKLAFHEFKRQFE